MNNLGEFIDQLIKDKNVSGLTDEVREVLAEDLTQRLVDQIDRAVIEALPEEKAVELSEKLDDENFGDSEVEAFVASSGVDVQKVALETALRFRDLYLRGGE